MLPLRSLFDHKLWRDHKGAVALSSLRLAVPVVIEYSVRHWFSRWRLNLRRLFFAFVLFAILFTIAGFVPAVRFQSVAAYEFARYDIRVNGPLTDEYVSSIREITRQQIVVPLTQVSTTMRAMGWELKPTCIFWRTPPIRARLGSRGSCSSRADH